MTIQEQVQEAPAAVAAVPSKAVKINQDDLVAQKENLKRPLEQETATTILNYRADADEDDEAQDGDYNDDDDEEEDAAIEGEDAEGGEAVDDDDEEEDEEDDDDDDEDVERDEEELSVDELTQLVQEAGFEVTDLTTRSLRTGKKIQLTADADVIVSEE